MIGDWRLEECWVWGTAGGGARGGARGGCVDRRGNKSCCWFAAADGDDDGDGDDLN